MDLRRKLIELKPETWKKLSVYKYSQNCDSIDSAINRLLERDLQK